MNIELKLKVFLGSFVLPMLAVAFVGCFFTREITVWRLVVGAGIAALAWRLSIALSEAREASE